MTKLKSEGECYFCKEAFAKSGIVRHLNTHLKTMNNLAGAMPLQNYYFITVEEDAYFLQILIAENQKLKDLDKYLRAIWLECCDHMSAFSNQLNPEISMNKTIALVFSQNTQLGYEYDFGSTTQLTIKIHQRYALAQKEGIILLSRNNPLPIICQNCQTQPATLKCTIDGECFCEKCKKVHEKTCPDAEDYAWSEIVNSPRSGVCGYDGGQIDKKRDGIYKLSI
jgi:hypothetical protein